MTGSHLNEWHQQGRVSLWRYVEANHSYAGWHLSADDEGCRSLLELLDLLAQGQSRGYRTVVMSKPSERLLNVPGRRFSSIESPAKLRIQYANVANDWSLAIVDSVAEFTFGEMWRHTLREAVVALSRGEGDFAVGPVEREQRLWCWWWPKVG